MTLEQAALFLVGSILTGLGFLVLGVFVLVLNNIFSKFWKPIGTQWLTPYRFSEEHPIVDKTNEPVLDPKK
jgi:hypothetical protein